MTVLAQNQERLNFVFLEKEVTFDYARTKKGYCTNSKSTNGKICKS